jgi:thymidylate synthase (FAD)
LSEDKVGYKPLSILRDDIGFVTLVDSMGDDLSVVNAARVSFGKRKDLLNDKDESLIAYMANEGHTSPFEHVTFTFNIKCPLFVTRQWMRSAA